MTFAVTAGGTVALGLGLLALLARTSAAEWWLEWAARSRGLDAEVVVGSLGLRRTVIDRLSLGPVPEVQVERLSLDYSIPELFAGKLRRVSIGELTVRADLRELQATSRPNANRGGSMGVVIGQGIAEQVNLWVSSDEGQAQISSSLEVLGEADGQLQVRSTILSASVDAGAWKIEGVEGNWATHWADGGPLDWNASLRLDRVEVGGVPLSPGAFNAEGGSVGGKVRMALGGAEDTPWGALDLDWRRVEQGRHEGRIRARGAARLEEATARLDLDLPLGLTWERDRLLLNLLSCGEVRIGADGAAFGVALAEAVEMCLEPGPEPAVRVEDSPEGARILAFRVPARAGPLELHVPSGDLRLTSPASQLELRGTVRAGGTEGTLKWLAGELLLSDPPLSFEGMRAELRASGAEELQGRLRIQALRDRGSPASLPPMRIELAGRLSPDRARADGRLSHLHASLQAEVTATHDLETGAGELRFTVPRVQVDETTEPSVWIPALAGLVSGWGGNVGATGRLHWTEAGLAEQSLVLDLDELSLAREGFEATGVHGSIHFDALDPLKNSGTQRLRFQRIEAGVPIGPGQIEWSLRGNGQLEIERSEADFAGGRIRVSGTGHFRRSEYDLVIDLEDVDLEPIVAQAQIEGLSATGRVTGRIPLRITGETLSVAGGTLAASEDGGRIRYVPEEAPPQLAAMEQGSLVLDALRDLQYEVLDATIQPSEPGEQEIRIRLKGRSEHLLGGRRTDLNLNLSGDLDRVISAVLLGSQYLE